MKKSKFTEAQIVFAIKQSEHGVRVDEICRKMGISEATFYNWKNKYGWLGISELRELRMLKDENARLKKMVADFILDKQMLQDVIKKLWSLLRRSNWLDIWSSSIKSPHKGAAGYWWYIIQFFYYQHHRREDAALSSRVREIAITRVRYGHWRIYTLLRREGWRDNHKRVYKVYKEERLNLRSKRPRRNKAAADRLERQENKSLFKCWSMDFVSDALFDGRKFRALTIVDNYSRECLAIVPGQSLSGLDVMMALEKIKEERGLVPERI